MSPALISILLQYGIQYGIPAVMEIIALIKKPDATVADIEALFAKIQTYEQYNIPNVTAPAPVKAP